MIPYANATLTAITAPGLAEDYDAAPTSGADRWSGALGIYVAQELLQDEAGERVDEVISTRLEIPYDVGSLVQRGDALTYRFDEQTITRPARNIIRSRAVGRVRVTLQDD